MKKSTFRFTARKSSYSNFRLSSDAEVWLCGSLLRESFDIPSIAKEIIVEVTDFDPDDPQAYKAIIKKSGGSREQILRLHYRGRYQYTSTIDKTVQHLIKAGFGGQAFWIVIYYR